MFNLNSRIKQFCESSINFAKTIISEIALSDEEKTFKPYAENCYIIHDLFFRIALDKEIKKNCWLYGGNKRDDRLAMKFAARELNSLAASFIFKIFFLFY